MEVGDGRPEMQGRAKGIVVAAGMAMVQSHPIMCAGNDFIRRPV